MADEQRQPNQRAADAPGPQPAPAQPESGPAPENPYRVPLQPPAPGQTQPGQAQPGHGHPPPPPGYQGQPPPPHPYPYPYPYQQTPPYQQAPYPSGWGPAQPAVPPRTEPQAVLALVLAITAWLVIPLGPAFLAYVVAYYARSSILASHGARRGLGLVSAARWVATIHLIVLPVGTVLYGKLTLTGVLF